MTELDGQPSLGVTYLRHIPQPLLAHFQLESAAGKPELGSQQGGGGKGGRRSCQWYFVATSLLPSSRSASILGLSEGGDSGFLTFWEKSQHLAWHGRQ